MRQFPERELTEDQEKIAGRHWQTRQIICLVDEPILNDMIKRLAAFGQIVDIRALGLKDSARRITPATDDDEKELTWDLHLFVTYRDLQASTSGLAAWEFAETWVSMRGDKDYIAKLKHHDTETPGVGVPASPIPAPGPELQGESCTPLNTRTIQFVDTVTGKPHPIADTLVEYIIRGIWGEVRKETRTAFRDEMRRQTEWVRALHSDWSEVHDFDPIVDKHSGTVTFESVTVAQLVWQKVRLVKMGDGRYLTGKWAMDPVLKDFDLEDGVRDLTEDEESETVLLVSAAEEEESEEE